MSEMIERAAKALHDCESVRAGHSASIIAGIARGPRDVGMEPFEECAETTWRPDARAALSAALDPMDATELQKIALIAERIRAEKRAERDGKDIWFDLDEARVWTLALKAHALGESNA